MYNSKTDSDNNTNKYPNVYGIWKAKKKDDKKSYIFFNLFHIFQPQKKWKKKKQITTNRRSKKKKKKRRRTRKKKFAISLVSIKICVRWMEVETVWKIDTRWLYNFENWLMVNVNLYKNFRFYSSSPLFNFCTIFQCKIQGKKFLHTKTKKKKINK